MGKSCRCGLPLHRQADEDPYAIKQCAYDVPQTDQWTSSEVDTMRAIVYAKFTQNRRLGERLRQSTFTHFYECTKNLFWGTGVPLPNSGREIDHTTFEGENHLGLILADVRARLRRDAQRTAHSTTGRKSLSSSTASQTSSPIKSSPPVAASGSSSPEVSVSK